MGSITALLFGIDIPTVILFSTIGFLVAVMISWHRDNSEFDFRKALIDPNTRNISFSRLGHFVCLTVSTGILLHETAKGRLNEWLFVAYMTAWAGAFVASKAIEINAVPQKPLERREPSNLPHTGG